jgi:hypothetical protein
MFIRSCARPLLYACFGIIFVGCAGKNTTPSTPSTPQQLLAANFINSGCGNRNATLSTRDTTVYTVTICQFIAASATMNFTATPSVSWVSASPPSGTVGPNSNGSVAVMASPRGLTPGTYNQSVTITASGYQSYSIMFTWFITT